MLLDTQKLMTVSLRVCSYLSEKLINASIGAFLLLLVTLAPMLIAGSQLANVVTKFLVLICMGVGVMAIAERVGRYVRRCVFRSI